MKLNALKVSFLLSGCLIVFTDIAVASEVYLYLIPRFRLKGDVMEVRDIARIEVKDADKEEVGATVIDETLYKDNYVDQKEIILLMREKYGNSVHVYGGGVAIVQDASGGDKGQDEVPVAVKKGDKIRFTLRRGLVKIDVPGTAMDAGLEGEEIPVKLVNDKILHGRISAVNKVESGQ